ncbi:MAG TPA: MFS transporter [Symbiobacteriaceae bacterium]|nr:MFS transporter [Symbiobacteriaceae bacterium]
MAHVFFFVFGAIGALSPFLALYYKQVGLSATQISVLISMAPILLFLSQPIFGPLTDRSGHRGRVLSGLLLIVTATGGLMWFGQSFWTLLPLVAVWAFFAGAIMPIADSIALGEAVRTGASYPVIRLWGSIGFLLVTVAMGRLYDAVSLKWAFPAYSLLMAIAWYFTRRLPADGVRANRAVWPAVRGLLRNRRLLAVLLLSGIITTANAAHATFFSVHMAAVGGTNNQIGWAWGMAAAVEVPVWMLMGKVTQRIGPLPLLAFSGFAYAVRFWLYGAATSPVALLLLQSLQAATYAIFLPTTVGFVGAMSGEELRTSGQALLVLVNSGIASVLGTMAAGRIVDVYGTEILYYVAGSVALTAGVGFVALMGLLRARERIEMAREG